VHVDDSVPQKVGFLVTILMALSNLGWVCWCLKL